jgi:hypothetical protein
MAKQELSIGGAFIEVDLDLRNLEVSPKQIDAWIENAARSVTIFYGKFPVRHAKIRIIVNSSGGNSIHGTTWGGIDGVDGFTRIRLGSQVTPEDLSKDWTLTHELVHMAFASLPDNEHWMEEGLATYIEPIARAQAGLLTPEYVWSEMMAGLPQGLPQPGEGGMNTTPTWGRTYWGGALFCLAADIAIRKETNNHKGLQDALRAIVAAGGTIEKEWPLSQLLQIGDSATGTTVLIDMYKQWKNSPVRLNLAEMWKELGVRSSGNKVELVPDSPLAEIRRGITAHHRQPGEEAFPAAIWTNDAAVQGTE